MGFQHPLALRGEFYGVTHQVENDLAQSSGVSLYQLRHFGCDVTEKFQTLFICPRGKGLQRLFCAVAQVEGNGFELNLSCLRGSVGRDLQFALMEKRNPEATRPRHIRLCPKVNCRSPTLCFGRDDKLEGGGPPWHEWRWMDRTAQQQPTRFRLPAFSSTHFSTKPVCPLIWTALIFSRPFGTWIC
jgi:hypothetical protein